MMVGHEERNEKLKKNKTPEKKMVKCVVEKDRGKDLGQRKGADPAFPT